MGVVPKTLSTVMARKATCGRRLARDAEAAASAIAGHLGL
jgi:hypothetical protein